MIAQLTRFASVGLFATLLHVLVAMLVRNLLSLDVQASNFAGFLAAVSVSYFGHAEMTFKATGSHQQQMVRFGLLAVLGLLLSSGITYVICEVMDTSFVVAMAIVAVVVPSVTFLVSKYWVFAGDQSKVVYKDWIGVLFAIAFAGLYFAVYKDRPINHDTAWYLVATRNWLSGAQLYVDIVEVNPPLNFYLTVPVVFLAEWLSMSETNAQYLTLSILMAFSLVWVWNLLQQYSELDWGRQFLMLIAAAVAMAVPAVSSSGQREHLMVIFTMPYLFGHIVMQGAGTGKESVGRAAFAAIGICIKPHFVLIPIALTITEMFLKRSLKPGVSASNVTLFAIGGVYLVAAATLHPEYFTEILPIATSVYGAYRFNDATVIRLVVPAIPLLFLAASVLAVLYGRGRMAALPFAAVLAGCVIYFVQWTGFGYQAVPIHAFAIVGFMWLILQARLNWLLASVSALGLVACVSLAFQKGFYRNDLTESFLSILSAETPEPRIMVFSSSLAPSFPLVLEADAVWTSRYPALWLVPGAANGLRVENCEANSERCAKLNKIQSRTRTEIVDDFVGNSPNFLVFDNTPPFVFQPFNFIEFLEKDQRFTEAMNRYVVIEQDSRFTFWGLR
ncbi:GtrA family protein [Ruegeria arenilitoris]|uniref:GtrA family protein n=1 Tax=Ruegeria arenilitoris TaxID=1173585 RepID=UPI00147D857E|nr:GtrA family protein [Ruegeria arenilitoris]